MRRIRTSEIVKYLSNPESTLMIQQVNDSFLECVGMKECPQFTKKFIEEIQKASSINDVLSEWSARSLGFKELADWSTPDDILVYIGKYFICLPAEFSNNHTVI